MIAKGDLTCPIVINRFRFNKPKSQRGSGRLLIRPFLSLLPGAKFLLTCDWQSKVKEILTNVKLFHEQIQEELPATSLRKVWPVQAAQFPSQSPHNGQLAANSTATAAKAVDTVWPAHKSSACLFAFPFCLLVSVCPLDCLSVSPSVRHPFAYLSDFQVGLRRGLADPISLSCVQPARYYHHSQTSTSNVFAAIFFYVPKLFIICVSILFCGHSMLAHK